jgi:hypothetical protein
MVLSSSVEFTRSAVIPEIPPHYTALHSVHGSQSFVPIMSHRRPFHPVPSHDFKVHSNIISPFMLISYRGPLSFSFLHQNTA